MKIYEQLHVIVFISSVNFKCNRDVSVNSIKVCSPQKLKVKNTGIGKPKINGCGVKELQQPEKYSKIFYVSSATISSRRKAFPRNVDVWCCLFQELVISSGRSRLYSTLPTLHCHQPFKPKLCRYELSMEEKHNVMYVILPRLSRRLELFAAFGQLSPAPPPAAKL